MIHINEIKETTCDLWINDMGCTTYIGKITSYLSLTDVRIQVKDEFIGKPLQFSGYYVTWKDAQDFSYTINICTDGRIEFWPLGFFDTYDIQLDKLLNN